MSSIFPRKDKGGVYYYQYYLKGKKKLISLETKDKETAKKRKADIDKKVQVAKWGEYDMNYTVDQGIAYYFHEKSKDNI